MMVKKTNAQSTSAKRGCALFALLFLGACNGQSDHVTVGSQPASGTTVNASAMAAAESAVTVSLFDPQSQNPQPLRQAVAATGAPIQLGMSVQGGDPNNLSMGYSGNITGITIAPTQVNIAQQAPGYYSFKIVMRDIKMCTSAGGQQCNIANQAVANTEPYDIVTPFLLQVMDPASVQVNQNTLGSGGGMLGDIVAGKGFLGSVIKGMMGSMGGGLIPTPSANPVPVTQYINQAGPHQ